jgi:hypothetical protein
MERSIIRGDICRTLEMFPDYADARSGLRLLADASSGLRLLWRREYRHPDSRPIGLGELICIKSIGPFACDLI